MIYFKTTLELFFYDGLTTNLTVRASLKSQLLGKPRTITCTLLLPFLASCPLSYMSQMCSPLQFIRINIILEFHIPNG
jgi:hypothetical protein